MKTRFLAGGIIAAALFVGSGAAATTVEVTLSGAHENINDASGVFGAAGSRITDLPFTETFLIDTDVGTFAPATSTSASYNSIFGAPGPYAVSGSLTINGHTFSTAGDNYSSAFITPGSSAAPTIYQILSDGLLPQTDPSRSNQIFSLELDGTELPQTLTEMLQLSGVGEISTTPFVLETAGGPITVYDGFIDGLSSSTGADLIDAQGDLFPTAISIATISAAPEPSVWGLMLLAVAVAGFGLRRRKQCGDILGARAPSQGDCGLGRTAAAR